MTQRILHGRFRTAAAYYLKGRPPYADALIRRVVAETRLSIDHRVLDIGTGPGQLAVAFAPYARDILAIDPEPEMLDRARANAAAAGATNVSFLKASSNELGAHFGSFHLTTIGRAFHWTDRAETLRSLDALVEPQGAVALFRHRHPKVPDNCWSDAYNAVLEPYRIEDDAQRRRSGRLAHEAYLLASAFSAVQRIGIMERRRTPLPHFIDRALSLGGVWSHRDPIEGGIDAQLRAALSPFADADGNIAEIVESEALIATRA